MSGRFISPDVNGIPAELRDLRQWLVWREEPRSGTMTKVPYQARSVLARTNAPTTWTSFDEAYGAYAVDREHWDGIGFAMAPEGGLVAFDLDNCRNPQTGELTDWGKRFVHHFKSYTELSPSGSGLRIIVRGIKPYHGNEVGMPNGMVEGKKAKVEIFHYPRYITFSGVLLDPSKPMAIEERQAEIDAFFAEFVPKRHRRDDLIDDDEEPNPDASVYTDEDVMTAMFHAKPKTKKLWEANWEDYNSDRSRGVFALLAEISWFSNFASKLQVARIFRKSKAYEAYAEKWDRLGDRELAKIWRPHGSGRESEKFKAKKNLEFDRVLDGRKGDEQQESSEEIDEILASLPFTDAGNAARFVAVHGDRARWNWDAEWLIWDGVRFALDRNERVHQLMLETARRTGKAADRVSSEERAKALRGHACRMEGVATIRNALTLARSSVGVVSSPDDFDANPYILNTQNGIVDLRTGELKPSDPQALCSMVTAAEYRPGATHPAFDAVLDLLKRDGREEYLQEVAGAALFGIATKAIFILTGPSGTAKSTLVDGLTCCLGDYAVAMDTPTLLTTEIGTAGGPRADLVKLRRKRLAVGAELRKGGHLNETTVKTLSGGDRIEVRGLYKNEYAVFSPSHTLVVFSNDEPTYDTSDDGMNARVSVVPFDLKPEKPDGAIRETLKTHPDAYAAVLAWAVEGAIRHYGRSMQLPEQPEIVRERTERFKSDQDPIGQWFEARVDYSETFTSGADLLDDLQRYCAHTGYAERFTPNRLSGWLTRRGIVKARNSQFRGFQGIALRENPNPPFTSGSRTGTTRW